MAIPLVKDVAKEQLEANLKLSTVGSGDSMVAGFIVNSLRSPDIVDSFRFASSCSLATSFTKGIATKEEVNKIYKIVNVNKLD